MASLSGPYKKPLPVLVCLMLIQNFPGYQFNVIDACHDINKEGQTTHKMNLEFQFCRFVMKDRILYSDLRKDLLSVDKSSAGLKISAFDNFCLSVGWLKASVVILHCLSKYLRYIFIVSVWYGMIRL
jgi:hypothetical protein